MSFVLFVRLERMTFLIIVSMSAVNTISHTLLNDFCKTSPGISTKRLPHGNRSFPNIRVILYGVTSVCIAIFSNILEVDERLVHYLELFGTAWKYIGIPRGINRAIYICVYIYIYIWEKINMLLYIARHRFTFPEFVLFLRSYTHIHTHNIHSHRERRAYTL